MSTEDFRATLKELLAQEEDIEDSPQYHFDSDDEETLRAVGESYDIHKL